MRSAETHMRLGQGRICAAAEATKDSDMRARLLAMAEEISDILQRVVDQQPPSGRILLDRHPDWSEVSLGQCSETGTGSAGNREEDQ